MPASAEPVEARGCLQATAGDAVALLQILRGEHLGVAFGREQAAHRVALIPTVFEQQPSIRLEMLARVVDDSPDIVETIVARRQRTGRFETQVALCQMCIVRFDVRRIGDDQVEPAII